MRAVIAEDSVLLREGVARVLGAAGFDIVGTCETADELLLKVRSYTPDVAIVDILTVVTGVQRPPPGIQFIDGALHSRLQQVLVRDTASARHTGVWTPRRLGRVTTGLVYGDLGWTTRRSASESPSPRRRYDGAPLYDSEPRCSASYPLADNLGSAVKLWTSRPKPTSTLPNNSSFWAM